MSRVCVEFLKDGGGGGGSALVNLKRNTLLGHPKKKGTANEEKVGELNEIPLVPPGSGAAGLQNDI